VCFPSGAGHPSAVAVPEVVASVVMVVVVLMAQQHEVPCSSLI
jgi:hypothetical protein